jgi:hypothetical protein
MSVERRWRFRTYVRLRTNDRLTRGYRTDRFPKTQLSGKRSETVATRLIIPQPDSERQQGFCYGIRKGNRAALEMGLFLSKTWTG